MDVIVAIATYEPLLSLLAMLTLSGNFYLM